MSRYMKAYEIEAKIEFYYQLFMIPAYGFIKLSIILFYRRIFLVSKNSKLNWAFHGLVGLTVVWTLAFFLLFLFGCREKIYLHWAPLEEVNNQCGNPLTAESALVISDLIMDLMIFCLPLPIIWGLQMRLGQKIALIGVFCVGFVAVAASIVRLAIYLIVYMIGFEAGYDLDQTVTTMLWWSMIEASLGLIVACLPVLRPLLSNIKFGRTSGKDRGDGVSEESRQRLFTLEPYPTPAFHNQSKPGSWATPSNPSLSGDV
ncbi:hypothetical protein AbraIFM66951_003936 [Aspergillus brasiliensis]|uniref:Rhodopsin domain-containing protein n=1 Tax=Aspergillus brasiliensis TaxID=319629 RepID=A0A9W6DTB7_9EURO|nr:hypothetical protein AbraCBS73388_003521 [Aspergillus brasiliensis]GKZ50672.1 hypothetical protein AbraIFM66951_003936 [Aspergillus brasiliensis]